MRIIYNRLIPFGRYQAINILGIVFAKSRFGPLTDTDRRHEFIHTLQQREMLFVGFYIVYVAEWLIHLAKCRNMHKAYSRISFEREAYANAGNPDYPKSRKAYSWTGYLNI